MKNNKISKKHIKLQEALIFFFNQPSIDSQSEIKPIYLHCVQVALLLLNHGYSIDVCIAGLFHDAFEDFSIEEKELAKEFGNEVIRLIKVNTKNSTLVEPTKGEELISRICAYGDSAIAIKLADLIDNLIYFTSLENVKAVEKLVRYSMFLKGKAAIRNDSFHQLFLRSIQKGKMFLESTLK